MNLPDGVRAGVERALAQRAGRETRIVAARGVGGGCISPAARVETDGGDVFFLKWAEGSRGPAGLFEAEGRSLAALAATGVVRVPEVIAVANEGGGSEWLLLEWLEPGSATAQTWPELGRALAALHRVRAERYGWPADNFIGPLPQPNAWASSWAAFWRERRLAPQLERALRAGHFDARARRRFEALLGRLDALLAEAEADGASLLHGDLWGGNVHVLAGGEAALIDPSSYHGHREVDLAMSELFGGFGAGFREAYREAWPLAPGYAEARRPVYQLYYLLVHVNLFGAGYVDGTIARLESVPL
ncbi:MAG TPA: fructosamine kinase family protein [Longimicrobiales bacterium]